LKYKNESVETQRNQCMIKNGGISFVRNF